MGGMECQREEEGGRLVVEGINRGRDDFESSDGYQEQENRKQRDGQREIYFRSVEEGRATIAVTRAKRRWERKAGAQGRGGIKRQEMHGGRMRQQTGTYRTDRGQRTGQCTEKGEEEERSGRKIKN